ncbi:uncharacterized protein [Palaemon carinicauda]|uniref:uncharacterized protein n=1 Tax=Palaemon carinicauda TaxID=392227 RepID=UPI0035B62CE5
MGDLNARVGAGEVEGVIGNYGVPSVNESDERLVDTNIEQDMVMSSSFFKKKDKNKYTWCSSLLVVAIYCMRVVVSAYDSFHLHDVYYGVKISYIYIIVTHITLVALSSSLLVGVCQERIGLVAPWVVANIAFMALEDVCCMYSNVLRDHINKRFAGICEAEMNFFSTRVFINIFCLWSAMRFLRNIRAGVSYKEPEAIEL